MELQLKDIELAAERLKPILHHTELDMSSTFSAITGGEIYLKCENRQKTGSFKIRGASNKIAALVERGDVKSVVASSAGNHAQGVAYSAHKFGIPATIVMPASAPIAKVQATEGYGAKVVLHGDCYDDAYAMACRVCETEGATFLHPYNDLEVIAGQGTIGLEILDQLPDVEAVVVPVGGGGLLAGVAFAIKSLAAGAASMYNAYRDHTYETLDHVDTFADGIAVKTPGETTFKMIEQYVDGIVTVSEDEIAAAILALMENQKLVAEGAGATPVAAALFGKLPIEGKKTVCLISGGNIDVNILSRVITRGMIMSGRKTNLMIALEDKPGQLTRVSEIISGMGANVVSVQYDLADPNMTVTSCFLKLGLETRDHTQIEQIKAKLTEEGFKLVSERA